MPLPDPELPRKRGRPRKNPVPADTSFGVSVPGTLRTESSAPSGPSAPGIASAPAWDTPGTSGSPDSRIAPEGHREEADDILLADPEAHHRHQAQPQAAADPPGRQAGVSGLLRRATSRRNAHQPDSATPLFRITRRGRSIRLSLVDAKGKPTEADPRRLSGSAREAVRDYAARLARDASVIDWSESLGHQEEGSLPGIADPGPELLDLAARASMLVNDRGRPILAAESAARLALSLTEDGEGRYRVSLVLAGDGDEPSATPESAGGSAAEKSIDGEAPGTSEGPALEVSDPTSSSAPTPDVEAEASLTAKDRAAVVKPAHVARPIVVSPRHAIVAGRLYAIPDLGPDWKEELRFPTALSMEQLPLAISRALSRHNGLTVEMQGWIILEAPPRDVRPALVFSSVDRHGFLHIRAVSSLPGYPPGFFEEHDITRVIEFEPQERSIRISEIVFPVLADEALRAILAESGSPSRTGVFEEGGFFILPPDFAERFLSESIGTLMTSFALFETSRLSAYRVRPTKPKLRLALKSGIDYLEGEAEIDIEGESFSYARFLSEYRSHSYIELSDGTRAYPEPGDMERFGRILNLVRGQDRAVRLSFFDFPLLTAEERSRMPGTALKRPEEFYRGINALKGEESRPRTSISKKKPTSDEYPVEGTTLRAYQRYGVRWLDHLRTHGMGGCLADEMGLGKTVQTIALLRRIYREGEKASSLIVLPRSLLYSWTEELARFAPELRVTPYHGSEREPATLAGSTIILTTYAIVRRDLPFFALFEYCYLVLDESQTIKNSDSLTSQAVMRLRARHRLALSGTPIENHLGELYALFDFLNPGMFGSRNDFADRYHRPIQESGDENALRDLRLRIYPFILRRLKREVLPDLPAKMEQVCMIDLDAEHLALYNRRRSELKLRVEKAIHGEGLGASRFLILQAFTELRRLASIPESEYDEGQVSAKREFLRERVAQIAESGHKCLVFTNYLATVDLVSRDIEALGLRSLVMTGATVERQDLVRQFQTDQTIKAFVMTVKTGGLGLNLTAADYVFIVDPWWNRSVEAQAIDRTHRIGQKNPVFCYRLIARDTIEEKILLLQERKSNLVSSLIGSDADAFKALDEEDIAYLLG